MVSTRSGEHLSFASTQKQVERVQQIINDCVHRIGKFTILGEELVPFGLKPIARSISWLVEQIVVQNLMKEMERYGISEVIPSPTNVELHDCLLKFENLESYVNIKTSLTSTDERGRFDISKASRLIELYKAKPNLLLLVAVVKVELKGVVVRFNNVVVFNVAWTPDPYYNRANHNLQAKADGTQTFRTNSEFVRILTDKVQDAGHATHY